MRIVGITRGRGPVEVASLSRDGASVTPIAQLRDFWSDPRGAIFSATTQTSGPEHLPTTQVTLVPPVLPEARVLCIGLNYRAHAAEGSYSDQEFPAYPTLFARWTRSLSVGGAPAPVPDGEDGLDWEGEVVAWVGSTLLDAEPDEALDAVLGYSVFNDLTARRAQKLTSQWILGKNADSSGPIGPMVPADEVGDLRNGLELTTRVNGMVVQQASTAQMVYTVGETLALVSRTLTLRPGDLLATGTPAGVGYSRTPPWLLQPGDQVEVEVERLGVLRTPVVGNGHRHRS